MKKILLLGAISSFCDLVKEIDNLNYSPVICDYYEDAPAKMMGYLSYNVSTTDTDQLLDIVEKNGVDGIISAFSDRNLMPALELCLIKNKNYFFSKAIIECLTDKKKMKQYFCDMGLPVIKYGVHSTEDIENNILDYDFPVVTKPIDAYGSKGIYVCNDIADIKKVLNHVISQSVKYTNEIIIEEYYPVDEISISAWVKDGKAYISCIYDVFRNSKGDVTLAAVSFPSKYTEKYLDKFSELLNKSVAGLNISEGPVTLQCFIGPKGIKVSELLCRLAGGSPYLYPTYFGGPNIAKMVIQKSVNDDVDYQNVFSFTPTIPFEEVFYDIQIMVKHKGLIIHNLNENELKSKKNEIADIRVYYPSGSLLKNVGTSGVLFARVVCKTARDADYLRLIKRIDSMINVQDENGNKISFINTPERLDVVNIHNIDWSFLDC